MLLIFLFLFCVELREAAQVGFELVVFGVGSMTAGAFHHQTAEDGKYEDAEDDVEGLRPICKVALGAMEQDEIDYCGGEDEDVGHPFPNLQISLIIHLKKYIYTLFSLCKGTKFLKKFGYLKKILLLCNAEMCFLEW